MNSVVHIYSERRADGGSRPGAPVGRGAKGAPTVLKMGLEAPNILAMPTGCHGRQITSQRHLLNNLN